MGLLGEKGGDFTFGYTKMEVTILRKNVFIFEGWTMAEEDFGQNGQDRGGIGAVLAGTINRRPPDVSGGHWRGWW